MSNKVIWQEGMFLLPQHFQANDRYFERVISEQYRLLRDNHWGITELEIDPQLLAIGQLGLTRAKGVFADGTLFDVPGIDVAPLPVMIAPGINETQVYLALPLRRAGSPEVGGNDNHDLLRYQLMEKEIGDYNAGFTQTQSLQFGKLALRLMLETEDLTGYNVIPIAKIIEITASNQIILDENFIAPCLNFNASAFLQKMVSEVASLLRYRGETLAHRISGHNTTNGVAELADYMLLQFINRVQSIFDYLTNCANLHPEQLYLTLLGLVGELATFVNPKRRPNSMLPYQHSNPTPIFHQLLTEIRQGLSVVLQESAASIKMTKQSNSIWLAEITDKNLLMDSTFVLAVYVNKSPDQAKEALPSQIKIAPTEELKNLISRSLPGIEIWPINNAPRQIPYHPSYVYFTFNQNHKLWSELKQSAALGFHIAGKYADIKLELWAIKEK